MVIDLNGLNVDVDVDVDVGVGVLGVETRSAAGNDGAGADASVKKASLDVQILLQLNSFCTQRLKCLNERANCSS